MMILKPKLIPKQKSCGKPLGLSSTSTQGIFSLKQNQSLEDALRSVTSEMFEDLCLVLLRSMGFRNAVRNGHHNDRDKGRDIEANYPRELPDRHNQINERWFFECKHQQSSITVDDINSKVAWAEASGADFLVILSFTDLTSNARQYITEYQDKHHFRILAWTGNDLLRKFRQHPQAIKEFSPDYLKFDAALKAELEAEERILLARNILTAMGVVSPELDLNIIKLLEEIISRCVRKQDVKSISMNSLEDGNSEIVYLLSAQSNNLLNEAELFAALASILDRHPDNNTAWQIANHFRTTKKELENRPIRYVLIGPVSSGKSCLFTTLLFEMIRDIRFSFEAETLFGFSHMHRTFRDHVINLRNEHMVPHTCIGDLPKYRMGVIQNTENSSIELLDTSGEQFSNMHSSQFLNGIIEKGDRILLIFDPSDGRQLLDARDEGNVLPFGIDGRLLDWYASVLKWAENVKILIIPIITKIDLISTDELHEKVIPMVKSLIPNCTDIIFSTSVLKKMDGQIHLQTIGITQLLELMVNEICTEK